MKLPIDEVLPKLVDSLRQEVNAVLIAEPGAGKTTRVPLALLDEPWLAGQGILLLEPRRLAARSAAAFMAATLGEPLGETVGYRIRQESRISPKTRITVVTEGILTRMLQQDPTLASVGLIIFDEFHERSLHADLGLALSRQSQQLVREDLRILVMSATLEAEPVSKLLGGAPVIQSAGRAYPVETRYLVSRSQIPVEEQMARTIQAAVREHGGNILAFLPGIREIRRTHEALYQELPANVLVCELHGSLTQEEQRSAIAVPPAGSRKVVLATSIAESSLTVEGVTVVVDAGLRRTQLFSPRTGMGRLATLRAAKDACDQRRGRAGRTAPGICYRLWTEAEHRALPMATPPEMLEADLAPLALELAAWGARSPAELAWLDPPPVAAYGQAVQLLQRLGALDGAGKITAQGREQAGLGLHPRLSRMLLAAGRLSCTRLACLLAAALEEPRMLHRLRGEHGTDAAYILAALCRAELQERKAPAELAPLLRQAREWSRLLGVAEEPLPEEAEAEKLCGLLLSYAYPDRIAQKRPDGRYLLSNGRGAIFAFSSPLARSEYLVAAEVEDEGVEGRILLAAEMKTEQLETYWKPMMQENRRAEWDESTQSVRAWHTSTLGALTYREIPDPNASVEDVKDALLGVLERGGLDLLPWTAKTRQLQQRIQFLGHHQEDWPEVSDEALVADIHTWLAPYMTGFKRKSDFQKLNLYQLLENLLTWEQRRQLESEAPTHLKVPSGSNITIIYEGPQAPYAAVRLQEVFGLLETPRLAFGQVPLVLHLLSPAGRPVQVTADLRSFWEQGYFEVKKDLKGRYPKHYWPDSPLEAQATRKIRPKS